MISELREDVRLYHRLRHPGDAPTAGSLARVALGSRGLVVVGGHRVVRSLWTWAVARRSWPVVSRAVRTFATVLENTLRVATKSEVRVTSELAPGVYLSDAGHVVLGARAIGRDTVIHHRVTIGWSMKTAGTPKVGERVWIGHDSVLAGDITIGDGCTILPGTVLTRSLPPGTLVQGNPARILRRNFDNSELRRSLATEVTIPSVA